MSRLSCVHRSFVRSCPDFCALTSLSCVRVKTFVRSSFFCAFKIRLLRVHFSAILRVHFLRHQSFVRSCWDICVFTSISLFHVDTFVFFMFRLRVFMSKLLYVYFHSFVRSCSDFRAFMSRISCVHHFFVHLCPDFCAFISLLCVHVLTFKQFCSDFCPLMSRFLLVHFESFVRSCSVFRVYVQLFVRSCSDFRAFMFRLSCVHQSS